VVVTVTETPTVVDDLTTSALPREHMMTVEVAIRKTLANCGGTKVVYFFTLLGIGGLVGFSKKNCQLFSSYEPGVSRHEATRHTVVVSNQQMVKANAMTDAKPLHLFAIPQGLDASLHSVTVYAILLCLLQNSHMVNGNRPLEIIAST
jgi:hypothetical protein